MGVVSTVQTIGNLEGPAGRLEALLNTGSADAPYSVVLAHPHPLFGGTMHNKVVYNAMKAFTAVGLPVLRFNFRGTGLSEGAHDYGLGEQDDIRAAVDWLDAQFGRPMLFAGFSFGSYTGLRACCGDARVAGRVGLGLPVQAAGRNYTYEFMTTCAGPKLFISGDQDEFCPTAELERVVATSPAPWACRIVAGADHFFQGVPGSPASKLGEMQSFLGGWLESTFGLTKS